MYRADRPCDEEGFTLIELLVSLTILAVILGLLGGALRVVTARWDAHAQQIDVLDMVSRAADILQRDAAGLARAVPPALAKSPRYLFKGDGEHMSFVALEPPYPTLPGPYFIDYSIAAGRNGFDLVRARAPYEAGMLTFPGATPANQVTLMEGAFRYQLSYATNERGSLRWYARWPFDRRLPSLIRLDIVETRSGGAAIPAIIVPVRADAELSCIPSAPGPCSADSRGELKASSSRQEKARSKSKTQEGGASAPL